MKKFGDKCREGSLLRAGVPLPEIHRGHFPEQSAALIKLGFCIKRIFSNA